MCKIYEEKYVFFCKEMIDGEKGEIEVKTQRVYKARGGVQRVSFPYIKEKEAQKKTMTYWALMS